MDPSLREPAGIPLLRAASTIFGDPSAPAILFVHGIRLGRAIWEPHARRLADSFCVVTLDLPGHGALAGVPFTLEAVDGLIDGVIERILERPAVVVGYSLGGYVTMLYAHRHPAQTSGLLLADCTLELHGWGGALWQAITAAALRLPPNTLERLTALSLRATLPRELADTIVPLRFNRNVFAATSHSAREIVYSELLRNYPHRVLIVNGQYDLFFRADERRFARNTRADVRVIPRSDHVAPLRRPEEFSSMAREFAREVYGLA